MSKINLIEPTEKPRKRLFEAGEIKLFSVSFLKIHKFSFIGFDHLYGW